MLALARRILRDDGDAEDVVQEVFSQAWRTAPRYEAGRGSVAGWLLMIARTRAIDRLRAKQARPDTTADILLETMPGNTVAPSDQVIANEQYALIRQGLVALPVEQRTALELAYFEGLSAVRDRRTTGGAPRHDQDSYPNRALRPCAGACGHDDGSPRHDRRHARRIRPGTVVAGRTSRRGITRPRV